MSNQLNLLFGRNIPFSIAAINARFVTLLNSGFSNVLVVLISLFVSLITIGGPPVTAQAQAIRVQVKVSSSTAILITVEDPQGVDSFSFRNSYAGIIGLGDRISAVEVETDKGEWAVARRIGSGEFRQSAKATTFRYTVNLNAPEKKSDLAHTSWLNNEFGVLMLSDLLPELSSADSSRTPILVSFDLPAGWEVASAIIPEERGSYLVSEPDDAVFLVGGSLRERVWRIDAMEFAYVTPVQWTFSDEEVLRKAGDVIRQYSKLTGFRLNKRSVLMLAPFPEIAPGRWSAETRGSTVMLMFGRGDIRANALGLLGVIFTHEFLHLWVPGALHLTGDYDWFFEGFTLYEALRTALKLRYIDFNEYLNTISRVYNSYLSSTEKDQLTLLEASSRRWSSGSTLVYDKGFLVALMYDLAMRAETGGKSSLDDIYLKLFARRDEREDANKVIIQILSAREGLEGLTSSYIQGHASIELERLMGDFGFEVQSTGQLIHIVVRKELTKEQRSVLRSMGYRN